MIAKHIQITGKVQGVFFRKSAKQKANELDIFGWVKNIVDNKVEIVAQGSEENINKFIIWCRQGPSNAEVKNIQIEEEEINMDLKKFTILHAD